MLSPAPETLVATAMVWVLAAIWMFVVTPSWVRLPADAYGAQLLAACDVLDASGDKGMQRKSAQRKR
ncbi:MAG: hypothetical protein WAN27_02050 [Xanthobacteraceae bacterium]|jgi:hypothetical protein